MVKAIVKDSRTIFSHIHTHTPLTSRECRFSNDSREVDSTDLRRDILALRILVELVLLLGGGVLVLLVL
jgi:hypothetical protein